MISIHLKLHEKSIKPYFPLQLGSKHSVVILNNICSNCELILYAFMIHKFEHQETRFPLKEIEITATALDHDHNI